MQKELPLYVAAEQIKCHQKNSQLFVHYSISLCVVLSLFLYLTATYYDVKLSICIDNVSFA